jgi:fumarate reductase flavoprotein subunit
VKDVVVVGAGIGGLSAAVRAAELGASVTVLEKGETPDYLCNTRITGGAYSVCRQDTKLPPSELEAAILAATENATRPELARALATDTRRMIEWLRTQGIKFITKAATSRDTVVAPPRTARPGVKWEPGRGGDVLLKTMVANLHRHGGSLELGTRAVDLIVEDRRCAGVIAERNGQRLELNARAVVVADGGFQNNADLVRSHIGRRPEKILQRNAGTAMGDGLAMVLRAGGAAEGLSVGFYGHLVALEAFQIPALWPYPTIDGCAASGIVVGPDGKRFADEGFGGTYIANAIARLDDPLCATVIMDAAIWNDRGAAWSIPPNPWLEQAGGTVYRDASLAGLAAKIGVNAMGLEQTVSLYNDALKTGRLAELSPPRTIGRQHYSSTHNAYSIVKPPFHAIKICAGMTFTMGGIAVDANAQVRRFDESPFAGLFATGSAMGGLDGGAHNGYVGGLAKATVFGLRAAEQIAMDIGVGRSKNSGR